jgi:tetratricopeptide (TPR) repeat protein
LRQVVCGRQNEVLAYFEGPAEGARRREIEAHISICDDCRELLAVLVSPVRTEYSGPVSEDAAMRQVNRVKDYVARDQVRAAAAPAAPGKSPRRESAGFFLSFPQLAAAALIVSAVGLAVVFLLVRDDRVESANKLVATAMAEHGRNTAGCLAGLDYAAYSQVRGAESDELKFTLALNRLKQIDEERATYEERIALARVRIATGNAQEVAKGRDSLMELSKLESRSALKAQVFNDLGVAQIHLSQPELALESFNKAIAASPGLIQARFNRALALEQIGRDDDAAVAWQEFIDSVQNVKWKQEAADHLEALRVGHSVK